MRENFQPKSSVQKTLHLAINKTDLHGRCHISGCLGMGKRQAASSLAKSCEKSL